MTLLNAKYEVFGLSGNPFSIFRNVGKFSFFYFPNFEDFFLLENREKRSNLSEFSSILLYFLALFNFPR